LQATGENSGTWGTITNTNLGTALEQAVVGYGNPSYPSDANLTLTYTDTNAAQAARALVLNVTSAVSLTATRELIVPTIQKQYIVQNNTTGGQSITVKTSAGTGITVPNGRKAHLYVNGTDVIFMDDFVDINGGAIDGTAVGAASASTGAFTSLAASGTTTLSGLTASTALALDASKNAVSVTNTGTGNNVLATSPTLVTPDLGTPSSATLTNATGLPVSTGISGLGAGVATFLATPSSTNLRTAVTDETGTGALVFATSPTLVTPALGTPSALVGTNITGTAAGLTAGNVTTNANLTGAVTSVGNATSLGSFTSAQLAGALTDETGSGLAVFATSPTLVTPALGTPSSATLTNATGLPISTGVSGLGAGVATFLATPSSANLRTAVTDETGTGALVFATSPTLVTPALGTPASGVVTNLTGTASININGTVGATTPNTGNFTVLTENASPVAVQTDIGTDPNEIPLNQYLGALAYIDSEWTAPQVGSGITGGTGTICKTSFAVEGGVKKMQVLIDLTGLNSGGAAGDIIGVDGTANPCYIAQIPSTFTILGGSMTCLETPAGGDTDIDLYSATEGTGTEDTAITTLTETQIINAGTQSRGTVTYFAADPAANTYLYLVGQSTSNATYTAGRLLIEVFGA
jgi:hypothetical protein